MCWLHFPQSNGLSRRGRDSSDIMAGAWPWECRELIYCELPKLSEDGVPPREQAFPHLGVTLVHFLHVILWQYLQHASNLHFGKPQINKNTNIHITHFVGRFWKKKIKHIHTVQNPKENRKYKKRSILHFCFLQKYIFFFAFLEKRYTVASYQSHITCRYITLSEFTQLVVLQSTNLNYHKVFSNTQLFEIFCL